MGVYGTPRTDVRGIYFGYGRDGQRLRGAFQRQQVDMIVPVIICNSDQHQVQVMTDEKIAIARKTEIMKIR